MGIPRSSGVGLDLRVEMAIDENASGVALHVIRRFPPLALGIILPMDIHIEVVALKVVPRPRLRAALGAPKQRVDRPGHV